MVLNPAIVEQIRSNGAGLTRLSLRYNNINDNEADTLAGALKGNHTLTELDLGCNAIGDVGATALVNALRGNHTLTELAFYRNAIGSAGAIALARTLKGNYTLTKLDLGLNAIGHIGAIAIAEALKTNHTLTELELYNNSIGAQGAIALADALKDNRNLTSLDIERNDIGDDGIAAFSTTFMRSNNIIYVNPMPDELRMRTSVNETIVGKLINKMRNNPEDLTPYEREEIQERIPAILYVGKDSFGFPKGEVLRMLAGIGIQPAQGLFTRRINEVREAQRQAALEDPSQGI